MTDVARLASELFTGSAVATIVVATGKGPPTGKASERISKVVDMLIQTTATRQTYSFMRVLSKIPEAVAALGWVIDRCEQRAARFLATLSPPVLLEMVVAAETRASDNAILLRCIGHERLVEATPLSAKKTSAVLASLRACIFPRNALPGLFSDATIRGADGAEEPAWAVHGVGSIGAYMDAQLDDSRGLVAPERQAFVALCEHEVERLLRGYETAVNAGQTVQIPGWAVASLSCTAAATAVAILKDGQRHPLAAGPCWIVSSAQFPAETQAVEVGPTSEVSPGVVLRMGA